MTLQHESPIPLYIQIKDLLYKQIQAGDYEVGSRLPSERELAQNYNVSRMTARLALQALAQEGLAYSRVGKGTFVSPSKINQELRVLTSFSEDMRLRGVSPSSRVQVSEVRHAGSDVAHRLNIPPEAEIVVLSRVRLADNKPLALETTHLPHRLCPNILDQHDFSRESLYEVLRRDYGWALVWADQVIEACLPDAHEREILHLDGKTPVLSIVRVTFDDQDQPVEYARSVYRGDQYQLHAVLRGFQQPPG